MAGIAGSDAYNRINADYGHAGLLLWYESPIELPVNKQGKRTYSVRLVDWIVDETRPKKRFWRIRADVARRLEMAACVVAQLGEQTMGMLFYPGPRERCLRGDPHLWQEMRAKLGRTSMPSSPQGVAEVLRTA